MKPKLILLIAALFSALFVPTFADTFQANQGKTVTLTATADGTQPFAYAWAKDGVAVTNSNTDQSKLILPNVQPAAQGTYTVTISNSAGQVIATEVFTLVVIPPTNGKITGSAS